MEISPVHNACSLLPGTDQGPGMPARWYGGQHSTGQRPGAARMRWQKINSFICRKFNVTMLSILAQRQFGRRADVLRSLVQKGGLKGESPVGLVSWWGITLFKEGDELIDCGKNWLPAYSRRLESLKLNIYFQCHRGLYENPSLTLLWEIEL